MFGFINGTELKFDDISSEQHREYTFPNGRKLRIENPYLLHVSKSGGHRLVSFIGVNVYKCYYVQPREGWSISWIAEEGKPNFVK